MESILHTGPSLVMKVAYQDGSEKVIGYASSLNYTVNQGQRAIFTVDSPFPAEIAQGAAPSMVNGSMTLYMPKGMTPESAGLVPYRLDSQGETYMPASMYLNIRLYDRKTTRLIFSADFCKVTQYSVAVRSKTWASLTLNFEGMFLQPGSP